jgi:hypothetical protein
VYNYYILKHTQLHYHPNINPAPSPPNFHQLRHKEPYTDTLKISYIEDSSPSPCSLFHVRGTFSTTVKTNQREGMGPLEYQAMPSLRVVAHEGVLYTFSNRSPPDRGKWCGPSRHAAWTIHGTYKITPLLGHLSSSQPGGPPCRVSSLAFGLIDSNYRTSLI